MINKFVLVRTHSAGVHCGILREIAGQAVLLAEARRIWRWNGANTLNEIATSGVSEASRISEPVESILLLQAIEVIPCTTAAAENLRRSRWTSA